MQKSIQKPHKKTALVLSGGGSRGAYQCGVWQALTELGITIDIVIGVSVGAINGSMVVQGDPIKTANLWREMKTDMIFDIDADAKIQDYVREFFRNQGAGTGGLKGLLRQYVDEDAIRNSPIDFGLVTTEIPSMKGHYLWKEDIPRGRLYDYITASASAFPAVHPIEIGGRYYIDGGYENNLPVTMALEKGATEVIAVYLDAVGRFRPAELEEVPNLTFIESRWDLGDFLIFDTENARRILRIGYLDAMKKYSIYDGGYYTFTKDAFDSSTLAAADTAARIFGLDPLILYRPQTFRHYLSEAVSGAIHEIPEEFEITDLANPAKLKRLFRTVSKPNLILLLAKLLREKGRDIPGALKILPRLLDDEIAAAKLLAQWELV